MPDGTLQLIAKPHPFNPDAVWTEVKSGQTIAQMLGTHVSITAEVSIGGHIVPRQLWPRVRPKAGQMIHVAILPQGGGNGSKWIRIVALVVITYLTWGIGTAWGAAAYGAASYAGVSSAVWAGAFSVLATAAVTALVPPPAAKGIGSAGGDPFEQLNSLTGTSN